MNVNEKIKARRQQLGLSDLDVAQAVEISIYAYGDIEQHPEEILNYPELRVVKKICDVLQVDFFELLDIRCAFCEAGYEFFDDYTQPRNKIIQQGRNKIGLSVRDVADIVGYEDIAITKMEDKPDYLETWVLSDIGDLADAIKVPLQILLSVKCPKCGR